MKIRKPTKDDFFGIVFSIIMLMFLFMLQSIINNPVRLIKSEISRLGYHVETLTLEQTSFWSGVYKSSVVVKDENGRDIEYWRIELLPGFQTIGYAVAYFEPVEE